MLSGIFVDGMATGSHSVAQTPLFLHPREHSPNCRTKACSKGAELEKRLRQSGWMAE